jgi:hypothetical protein
LAYLHNELAPHAPLAHRLRHAKLFEYSHLEKASTFGIRSTTCGIGHCGTKSSEGGKEEKLAFLQEHDQWSVSLCRQFRLQTAASRSSSSLAAQVQQGTKFNNWFFNFSTFSSEGRIYITEKELQN